MTVMPDQITPRREKEEIWCFASVNIIQEKMENMRLKQIQIMRGLAILMVVIHHTLNNLPTSGGGYLLTLVNSDVTIFFVISGYLFEKKFDKYKSDKFIFIKKKVSQLLVPYLFWSLILYIGAWVLHSFSGGKFSEILNGIGFVKLTGFQIAYRLITFQNSYVEYLWFIYILFAYFVVNIYVGRRLNKLWSVVIILLIASGLNYYFNLPYLVWKFLQHYSDFLIGRISYGLIREDKVNGVKRGISVSLLILTSFMVSVLNLHITDGLIYIWTITMAKHIMYWAISFCCFWFAFIIKDHKFAMLLGRTGDYSYDIYLMHTPYVVPVVAKAMYNLTGLRILSLIVTTLCGIVIPVIISSFVLRRIPILRRVALGK